MFLISVPKGPPCLPNIFHCAAQMFTHIPVYYPSFVGDYCPPSLGPLADA